MRLLLTILAYAASLAVVTPLAFFAALFLAGPHGGILPQALQIMVLPMGWLAVLALPVLVARMVWMRFGRARAR